MALAEKSSGSGLIGAAAHTGSELAESDHRAVSTGSSRALGGLSPAPVCLPPFRELYEHYFAFTWRSLRYLGVDAALLDDAVQEVWVVVHRRLRQFEGRGEIKTWLFGIALNVQRNLYRSERRHTSRRVEAADIASPATSPFDEIEAREAWTLVLTFLDTLDDTRRAVFVASLLEGLSPRETAAVTGLGVVSVYHRVRALRRAFRRWVERVEAEQ